MKIKNKLNISFILIFFFVTAISTFIVIIFTSNFVRNNIFSSLSLANEAKAEHISTFINDEKKTSVILSAASIYRDLFKEPEDSDQYLIIKDKVNKRLLRTLEADPFIDEVFLIGINGKILASSDKKQEGVVESNDDYFTKAQKETFFKDVYYSNTVNKLNYTVSSPVLGDNGDLLGVSVLRYLPKNFFSIINNGATLNSTEENFLINKDKYFLSPSLSLGEDVILREKVETKNTNDCYDPKEVEYITKNGHGGLVKEFGLQTVETKDYRGVDVIATHSYIPETEWCLVTKIDKAELLSFQKSLILVVSIMYLISLLFLYLIGSIVVSKITKSLSILKLGVDKIKKGDFDYKVEVKTKDEIGELADSFNSLVLEVKESKGEIEKRVKEQTEEINIKAKDLGDQKKAILNILEDSQKEKNKVELLAQDLEKFKLAVENASDQIVITDVEGIVLYGNRAVERITGYKPGEALGKKAGFLWKVPMPVEYYENLWNVIKNKKETFVGEIQNKRKDGGIYTAIISISSVLNNKGDIIYFVAIERDITREKEVDKAKTEFVSLASHQLRTPLSSINWYTEMLLAGDAGSINDNQKKYLEEVASGNRRMIDLVDDLLNASRLDMGTFIIDAKPIDLVKLLKSVIDENKPQVLEKNITIEEKEEGDLSNFQADEKLLRMVFQNLISNSIKYTKPNGSAKIYLGARTKGQNFGAHDLSEDCLVFSVEDSGMGIPSHQQEMIFRKLFRADNAKESETEGTGLGLYIIKSIIDKAGGQIWFNSEEDKGTTFFVTFPISGMQMKENID